MHEKVMQGFITNVNKCKYNILININDKSGNNIN